MRPQQKPFVVEIRKSRARKEVLSSSREPIMHAPTVTHATKQQGQKGLRLDRQV